MTNSKIAKYVTKELNQYGVRTNDPEFKPIFDQVLAAADILSKEALTQLIEDLLELRGI